MIFAYYLFSPDDLNKFAKSSINSILFLSNFYFWKNSGYWDESNTNPLLHTWTLSLEWQFYFFISIFLFIGWKFFNKKLNLLIFILFCISLFLSVAYIGRNVSFFLNISSANMIYLKIYQVSLLIYRSLNCNQ